jgi:glycosyltransferase involved in cell wall biosynthesis
LQVCTIIAKNYLAHARVFARSFTEHHPEGRVWTLIVDDFSGHIDPAQEPFEVLTPDDIGCDAFTEMAMRYTVLELSTAVKPWLLRHLMQETAKPITYLDPDIKIYGSLQTLDDLAAKHGLALIPHNLEPIPADGRKPSQVDIMIAGVYNLGYASMAPGEEIDELLDWWSDRLRRDCRVDPVWGYFVDQRWFDLVPGFLSDLAIVREPEYNVAYWNLHSRKLGHNGRSYVVDGRPLAFFHFSGFDPAHPLVLSRHQNRIDVVSDPILERLLADYASEVMAEGHASSSKWPYTYGALADGLMLDQTARALFDVYTQEHAANGVVPSPFTPQGAMLFEQWLRQSAPGGPPGVNRVLAHVYQERSDLRGAYPDLVGADREKLLRWADKYGRKEVPLLAQLSTGAPEAPSADATNPAAAPSQPLPSRTTQGNGVPLRGDHRGVNVVGYFRSEVGTGEAARQVVGALDAAGVPSLPIHGQTIPVSRQGFSYKTVAPEEAAFPINLICMNADMLPEFASQAGPGFFAGRYSIGLWFWEVSRFPERWSDSFSLLEEVWAPTEHVAGALERLATLPVTRVRIPVQPRSIEPRSRADLALPEHDFLFLSSFDYLSVFERKNPLALIDAFKRAFEPGEGARLVLKCINQERDPDSHAKLLAAAAEHPEIDVMDRYLTPGENLSLTALCDSYVSLHRAEGFGLVLAEAMWLGKPVIATGYSGNLDFMTESNSLLVHHRLVPIGPNAEPYPSEGEWADPDLAHAAILMRQVFDDREAGRELGKVGAQDIRRTHSPEVAGQIMYRRLESIRGTGRGRAAAPPERSRTLAALPLQVQQGPPEVGTQGPTRRPRQFVRKVVLRLIRPFAAYQQGVNRQLVAGLEELNSNVLEARRAAAVERAFLIGEMRGYERLPSLVEAQARGIDEINLMMTLQTDRALYLALGELQRRHEMIGTDPSVSRGSLPLSGSELRGYSQNGEDGVLAEILRRIGAPSRFFVEFGVESGREGNCVYLADVAGWRGLFMEADSGLFELLSGKYATRGLVQTVKAKVTAENVEGLFGQASVPGELDVLSIDVDGQDYWTWLAIENYRPRVVVIEYNSALDPRRKLVQPNEPAWEWDGTEYFGASLGAMRELAQQKGYRLVHAESSGVNAFFVRADLGVDAFPDQADVAIPGPPNYFQAGYRHPAADPGRRYLNLDTGELVVPGL